MRLLAYPVGGTVTTVIRLDRGDDFLFTFAVENADGTTTVYLDPGPCGENGDIARVTL